MTTEKDKARVSDNELIAEFMGFIPRNSEQYGKLYKHPDLAGEFGEKAMQFRYNTSWNDLMLVVEKINKMNHSVHIYPTRARFYKNNAEFIESINPGYSLIEVVHSGVVQFIKWHNEQR